VHHTVAVDYVQRGHQHRVEHKVEPGEWREREMKVSLATQKQMRGFVRQQQIVRNCASIKREGGNGEASADFAHSKEEGGEDEHRPAVLTLAKSSSATASRLPGSAICYRFQNLIFDLISLRFHKYFSFYFPRIYKIG
jgi:hypothetical protein